jgi:glycine cleavage system regulatory protein
MGKARGGAAPPNPLWASTALARAKLRAMRETLVLTVLGADRTGLVEALADRIADAGGNWEASHMARLAGQFAGILLVTVDRDRVEPLLGALRALDDAGLHVSAQATAAPAAPDGGARLRLELTADDRPGIVRDVSRVLAERGVNVEELESRVTSAPMSGEALFCATAILRLPPGQTSADLRASLEALASELMVDIAEC